MDITEAREMHEHETLIACAALIKELGLAEFLHRLGNYSPEPGLVFVTGYALKLEKDNAG